MKHPTFYRTIVDSPQWQAWVKENEQRPQFDVHESMECGWLSDRHFQAFLTFCKNFNHITMNNIAIIAGTAALIA